MTETKIKSQEKTYFHSWIADTRNQYAPNVSKDTLPSLRFFDGGDLEDPTRTNMDYACSLSPDKSFKINTVRISTLFSGVDAEEFIRAAVLTLWIGDKPMLKLPARFCMHLTVHEGLRGVAGELNVIPIPIPPRQPVYAELNIYSDRLNRSLEKIQKNEVQGYAEIKVELEGEEREYQRPKEQPAAPLQGVPLWMKSDEEIVEHVTGKLFAKTTSVQRGSLEKDQREICKELVQEILNELKSELEAANSPEPIDGDMHINDKGEMQIFDGSQWKPLSAKIDKDGLELVNPWNPASYLGKKE